MALSVSKKIALSAASLFVAAAGTDAGDAACPGPALDSVLPQLMNVQLLQSDLSVRRAKDRAVPNEAEAGGVQAAGLEPEAEAASAATASEHAEYVLKNRASVSKRQIDTFQALFSAPGNNRPVQPVNQRPIAEDRSAVDPGEFAELAPPELRGEFAQNIVGAGDEFTSGAQGMFIWGYDEPERWSSVYPECGGLAQSPIDINEEVIMGFEVDEDATPQPLSELLSYRAIRALDLINNGHSIQVSGNFGELRLPDGVYEAQQFHFHFPSEHTFFGKRMAGEMHIVHQRQGAEGEEGLAVIAVMLNQTTELDFTPASMSQIELLRTTISFPSDYEIDLGDTFAEEIAGRYYHYEGSLTAPPCSERVHWYVLENSAVVTIPIINRFKELFPSPANSRPLQPLNGRAVVRSRIAVGDQEFGES